MWNNVYVVWFIWNNNKKKRSYIGVKVYYSDVFVCVFFVFFVCLNQSSSNIFDFGPCASAVDLWRRASFFFLFYLTPIYAQRISLRGTIVAALLLLLLLLSSPPLLLFFWGRGEWDRERRKHLPLLLPPDSDAHRPQYSDKSRRCFTLPPPSVCIQSNYLSSIKINNSWLGWCGQRL